MIRDAMPPPGGGYSLVLADVYALLVARAQHHAVSRTKCRA